jgi:hypothetical protein
MTQKIIQHLKQNDEQSTAGMHSVSTSQPNTMLGTDTLVLLHITDSYIYLQPTFPNAVRII